jgi:hypothetical protein
MNWETFKPQEETNPFATPEMPKYDEIPEEFKRHNGSKWNQLFNDMFYSGLSEMKTKPKKGIDSGTAWDHLHLWASSFEPKHEHKEAAFAYMASIWFDSVTYKKGK